VIGIVDTSFPPLPPSAFFPSSLLSYFLLLPLFCFLYPLLSSPFSTPPFTFSYPPTPSPYSFTPLPSPPLSCSFSPPPSLSSLLHPSPILPPPRPPLSLLFPSFSLLFSFHSLPPPPFLSYLIFYFPSLFLTFPLATLLTLFLPVPFCGTGLKRSPSQVRDPSGVLVRRDREGEAVPAQVNGGKNGRTCRHPPIST